MEIKCPKCDKDLLIEDSELNEKIEYPSCLQHFTIELERPPVIEDKTAFKRENFKGRYVYKAVPFIGVNKSRLNPNEMAIQLESEINNQASEGWEFFQHADVQVMLEPGCLGTFLGRSASVHHINQLIFRKEIG